MNLENKVNEESKTENVAANEATIEAKAKTKDKVVVEEIRGIPYRKLEKSAINCMRISSIIVFGCFLLPGSILAVIFADEILKEFIIAFGILWALALIYIAIAPKVRYERYRYSLDESAIRVRSGLFWVSEEIVPMERLHKLQTSQGPIDRIFKLSKLSVTTAGGDVTIKFLKDEQAEEIAEALKKKINDIAIAERMK